ncbi:hypothetical protein ACTNDY_06610 [Tissierellaceae bacterium HCP3S3_D8]
MKININVRLFNNAIKNLKLIKGEGLVIRADETIELISNNLENQIEMSIEIPGSIFNSGSIFIPEETLKMMEGFKEGEFVITNKSIICGNKEIKYFSKHDIKLLDYEFNEANFTLSPKELKRLLEVSYATGNDKARPQLSGICIKQNKFLALNGFIGGIRESNEFNYDGDVIVSEGTWKVLRRLKPKKDIEVYISKEHIRFKLDYIKLDSKLIVGKLLNLEELFKEGDKMCSVNVTELKESIKIMEKIKVDNKHLVTLTILNSELALECIGLNNTFKDTLNVESNIREEFKIVFDIKNLKPVINQYKDKIELQFTTSINPLIIKTIKQADLVLPVRVRY